MMTYLNILHEFTSLRMEMRLTCSEKKDHEIQCMPVGILFFCEVRCEDADTLLEVESSTLVLRLFYGRVGSCLTPNLCDCYVHYILNSARSRAELFFDYHAIHSVFRFIFITHLSMLWNITYILPTYMYNKKPWGF